MSVRRKTTNRLTLYRACHTCGKVFRTTADNPFMRQMYNVDGKRQKICYFCCESCWRASYKHKGYWDGLYAERKKATEAARDTREKNRRYYAAHAEELRQKARERRQKDLESAREDVRYQHKKRRLQNGINTKIRRAQAG